MPFSRSVPLLATLLLSSLTSAQSTDRSISGPFKPGPANSQEALQLIASFGQNPNRTSSLTFPFTANGTSTDWTWRVNITTINVPNSGRLDDLASSDADYSQGLQVVNAQWGLALAEEDGSLSNWLAQQNMNLTVQTLMTSKPTNITESYSNEDDGDCSSVLGDQCTQSIMMASDSARGAVDFAGLEGCEDTLNAGSGGGSDGTSFAITASPNATDTNPGSETLWYRTSPMYTIAEDNLAHYNESVGALQILLIRPEYGTNQEPRGESDGPKLFCRIVDKEVVDTTAGQDGQESGAMRTTFSVALLCSFVLLAIVLQ